MKPVNIIQPGTDIQIWGNVKARIEYVMIEPGQVSYRVKFWNGQALVSELIPEHMVISPSSDITIGFK